MEKKAKGRPPKPAPKRKRLQYSVWVSAEEKRQIDQLIEAANLPASQFFLTQVIEKPIQRPRKKSLPKSVGQRISVLEKLAGLLSLAVLKTKDKDMAQAEHWQQSSRNVKWISTLLLLYIFEDFELPKLRRSLQQINAQSQQLYWQSQLHADKEMQALAATLHHESQELLTEFEKHYQVTSQESPQALVWEQDADIHHAIEQLKNEFLRR